MQTIVQYDSWTIPALIYGTYQLKDNIEALLLEALRLGYRGIDTASVYRNEQMIGQCLKKCLDSNNLQRSHIHLTTKLAATDMGEEKVACAVTESMTRLNVSYLDLYLIHWPGTSGKPTNDGTNQENRRKNWQYLETLVLQRDQEPNQYRKIRSIGVSNYTPSHIREMIGYCSKMPAVIQNEYHPFYGDNFKEPVMKAFKETFPETGDKVIFQAYSPLGRADESLFGNSVLNGISTKYGKSLAQTLIRWSLQKANCVIVKTGTVGRLEENFDAFDWELTDDDIKLLTGIENSKKMCWNPEQIL